MPWLVCLRRRVDVTRSDGRGRAVLISAWGEGPQRPASIAGGGRMAAAARRKENAPRGLSYGMWRAPWLAALIALLAQPAVASIFAEGGRLNGGDASGYQSLSNDEQQQYEEQLRELYDQRMAEEEAALAEQANYEQQLAEIISQYQAGQLAGDDVSEADKLEVSNQYGPQRVEDDVDVELQPAPEALKQKQEEIKAQKTNKELVEKTNDNTEKPVVAQKKGQSEFVSFVEPVPAAQTRDIPSLEKRRLAQAINGNAYSRGAESNLMMMAIGCLLVIGVIGGAIGSIVYRRRKDSPDDSEYAPYAGTGPFKRAKKGDKGDETLAYKAQLHHYQQAKQKIICGDDAPGVGLESDEEECADDENNFSVYECPGLAPTGDIEVHNPNFGQ